MKSKSVIMIGLFLLLPFTATAQQQIEKTFDALRQSKAQKEVWSEHTIEKDPETGKLEGLSDIYDFLITDPQNKNLVNAIEQAFHQDEGKAYSVRTGNRGGEEHYTTLAVGNSNRGGVAIGLIKGSKYIYALFLDPEDPARQHRYAYALEWVDDGDKIRGRIAKTYATTLKYRASKKLSRTISVNGNEINIDGNSFSLGSRFPFDNSSAFDNDSIFSYGSKSSESWLSEFNTFKNLFLNNPTGTAANYYVSHIYKLCKNAGSIDDAEKVMVIKELEKLKKAAKDDFLKQMFEMSSERLNK